MNLINTINVDGVLYEILATYDSAGNKISEAYVKLDTLLDYYDKNEVDSHISSRLQEIVGDAPEALDTLKELSDALSNDPTFATTITKKLTEVSTKLEEETKNRITNDTNLENSIVGIVKYKDFNYNGEARKTIELANFDSISGIDTDGNGHNLVMLSKWNVADFGAKGVHLNLNGKELRPTYNDNGIIALHEDLEPKLDKSVYEADKETFALKSDLPENYLTADMIDAKADKDSVYTKEEIDANCVKYTLASNKKVINLANGDLISAKINPDNIPAEFTQAYPDLNVNGYLTLMLLNAWNLVDIGSPYTTVNLTSSYLMRPTIQTINADKSSTTELIAYVSEVNSVKEELLEKINNDLATKDEIPTNVVTWYDANYEGDDKKVTMLDNMHLIMAKTNPNEIPEGMEDPGSVAVLQLNKWNIVDVGSPKTIVNLNTLPGYRPTVQEAGQSGELAYKIAYTSDVEEVKGIINTEVSKLSSDILNIEQSAKSYADLAIADLIDSAPEELNTLKELAEELANLDGVVSTITSQLAELKSSIETLSNKVAELETPNLDGYATELWVLDLNYLTEHLSLEGYATESYVLNNFQTKGDYILNGSNVILTGYTPVTYSAITNSDSVNLAIAKLESLLAQYSDTINTLTSKVTTLEEKVASLEGGSSPSTTPRIYYGIANPDGIDNWDESKLEDPGDTMLLTADMMTDFQYVEVTESGSINVTSPTQYGDRLYILVPQGLTFSLVKDNFTYTTNYDTYPVEYNGVTYTAYIYFGDDETGSIYTLNYAN